MELITKTLPYVTRAPRDEGHGSTITRQAAYEAFNSIPIGMIITDENAGILHLNRAAEDLVLRGRGLVVHNGTLSATTRNDAARLRQMVSQVVSTARHGLGSRTRALSLHRSADLHPLSIVVRPMWCPDGRDPNGSMGPFANLTIADPDRRMEVPAELLRSFFDLTPAESVVLERLVQGLTLQEIADASGTSRNTVRNQLHIVFEKTGTNRQAELIKLVLSTAVWAYGEAPGPAGTC